MGPGITGVGPTITNDLTRSASTCANSVKGHGVILLEDNWQFVLNNVGPILSVGDNTFRGGVIKGLGGISNATQTSVIGNSVGNGPNTPEQNSWIKLYIGDIDYYIRSGDKENFITF
jgi:hypothetical protein